MDRTWRQCNRESLNADSLHQDGKLVHRKCARYLWKISNPAPQGSKNGYPFNSKFAKWIYTQTSDRCTFMSACRIVFDAFPIQIIYQCFRVINLQSVAQGLRLLWDSLCGPAGKSNALPLPRSRVPNHMDSYNPPVEYRTTKISDGSSGDKQTSLTYQNVYDALRKVCQWHLFYSKACTRDYDCASHRFLHTHLLLLNG